MNSPGSLTAGVAAAALLLSSSCRHEAASEERPEALSQAEASGAAAPAASATPGQMVTMHFADGSDLSLIAGARGKLAGMSDHGGRVVLEEGEAHARIKERPGAAWAIVAGSSSIVTSGATLEVKFSPEEDELRVRALGGAATVRGPASPEGITIKNGEEFVSRPR